MAKKKRKIFRTPEERAAWEASREASLRRLQFYIDRLKAELAARGERPRGLQYYIDRAKAELAAKGQLVELPPNPHAN